MIVHDKYDFGIRKKTSKVNPTEIELRSHAWKRRLLPRDHWQFLGSEARMTSFDQFCWWRGD